MTTLELAEEIAIAVWYCCDSAVLSAPQQRDATQAVLKVLHENNSWFCRNKTEDWHEEAEERYEMVQPELFK